MIELSVPLLITPDIFSLIPSLEASVDSNNVSAPVEQNFSALLTELLGPVEVAEVETTEKATAETDTKVFPSPETGCVCAGRSEGAGGGAVVAATPSAPALVASRHFLDGAATPPLQEGEYPQPEVKIDDLIWADVKKFEYIVKHEAAAPELLAQAQSQVLSPAPTPEPVVLALATPEPVAPALATPEPVAPALATPEPVSALATPEPVVPALATPEPVAPALATPAPAPAQPVSAEAAAAAEAQKQAIITTDPIINLQQQQLPPRIISVQRGSIEARLPERSKPAPATAKTEAMPMPTSTQFSDLTRSVEHIEQSRPAHHVEMPVLPQLQVVRTVSMEVGDGDSQVTIRIQERGGDVALQINAATEPMHRDLQASVNSLVHALRREEVQISSVEVTRKSPIDKVRRAKEAH